jgi:F-type H+-transporting ATPase subunit alpha
MSNTTKDFIVEQLKKQISDFKAEASRETIGTVMEVGDGIARITGLSEAMSAEMLEFTTAEGPVYGVALNLEEDTVGAVILGDCTGVKEGAEVKSTKRILEVPVGEALVGRVVSPLGEPLDGKGKIASDKSYPVEKIARASSPATRAVQTGIKAIDAMIPIGAVSAASSPTARSARPPSLSTLSSTRKTRG